MGPAGIHSKGVPGGGHSLCKGPGASRGPAYCRSSEEARVAGAERARGREGGGESGDGTGRGAVSAGPGGRGEDLGFSCVDRPVWWGGLGLGQGAKGGCSGEGGVRVRLTNMAGACLGGRGRRGGGTKARVACAAWPSRTGKAEPRLANV